MPFPYPYLYPLYLLRRNTYACICAGIPGGYWVKKDYTSSFQYYQQAGKAFVKKSGNNWPGNPIIKELAQAIHKDYLSQQQLSGIDS